VKCFYRYLSIERGFSRNTCIGYCADARLFINYCALDRTDPLSATSKEIEKYLWTLRSRGKLKSSTVFRKVESLKAFYKFLVLEGRVKSNPMKNFKSPRLAAHLPKFLSKSEMQELLNFPSREKFWMIRTQTILELLYACGMRVSELLSLRLESVNLNRRWIRIFGKGAKERIVPVNENACEALRKYIEARYMRFSGKNVSSELFVSKFGKKLSRISAWKDVKKLARLAGVRADIHPHIFRHTFASHLLEGGADLRSLQEMLGHASLNTTQIYAHLQKSAIKSAHKKFHPDKGL